MVRLHIKEISFETFLHGRSTLHSTGQPSWALLEGSSGSFSRLRPSMVSSILAARVRSWVSWSGWSSLFADSPLRLSWSGTASRVGRSPLCPPQWRPFQYQRWRLVFLKNLRKEKLYKHDEGGLSGSHHLSTRGLKYSSKLWHHDIEVTFFDLFEHIVGCFFQGEGALWRGEA